MTTGEIPQSTALAEAGAESLAELLSRDPESYQAQDLSRIIEALRAQRVKWQASEQASPGPKAARKGGVELLSRTTASADDLGL